VAVRQWKDIEVISTHLVTGPVCPSDGVMRIVLQPLRKKTLLNLARADEFLLDALPFPPLLDQSCVFKNASGLGAQSVQNLAVQRRKSGRALGTEITSSQ